MNTCPTLMKRQGSKEYTVCGRKCKDEVCGYHKTSFLKKKSEASKEARIETQEKLKDYDELQEKYDNLLDNYKKVLVKMTQSIKSRTELSAMCNDLESKNEWLTNKLDDYDRTLNKFLEDHEKWVEAHNEKEEIIEIQDKVIQNLEDKLHVKKHHKRQPTKYMRVNNNLVITTNI